MGLKQEQNKKFENLINFIVYEKKKIFEEGSLTIKVQSLTPLRGVSDTMESNSPVQNRIRIGMRLFSRTETLFEIQ